MDLRTICWILGMGITAGTPLLYTATGEVIAERSGVLNLGIEGLMLMGAVFGYMVSQATGSLFLALIAVILIMIVLGLLISFLLVTLRANQVAMGIGIVFLGTGLSALVGKDYIGSVARASFSKPALHFLDGVEPLRLILSQDPMVYAAIVICILAWFFVYKTKPGLHLRAAGDNPATLDSLGVDVIKTRYLTTTFGTIMAGLGGAYLSLAYSPGWIENMAAGRGWLTIALVNFALWKPQNAIAGAYLFGIFTAFSFRLEAMGVTVPSYFLRMIPYLLPLFILCITCALSKNKSVAPKYLAVPYVREAK